MNNVTIADVFSDLSTETSVPLVLQKIQAILRRKARFGSVDLFVREDEKFKRVDKKSALNLPKGLASHFETTLKAWIPLKGKRSDWAGIWPFVIGKHWVGCCGLRIAPGQGGDPAVESMMQILSEGIALRIERIELREHLERIHENCPMGVSSAVLLHEIRNPLTTLSTLLQVLPEKRHELTFMDDFQILMSREIERLSNITGKFLESDGNGRGKGTRFQFSEVVDQTVRLFSPAFALRNVQLKLKNPSSEILRGNESQVRSMVFNLLKNALEVTPIGGRVKVESFSLSRQGTWVGLRVKDNGPGVPKKNRHKIFEPCFSSKVNGAGLGLFICHKIVQRHQGVIEVLPSKSGAVFQVLLPVEKRS